MPDYPCEEHKTKIAVLEEQMKSTKDFVSEMQSSHLPHIYSKLEEINIKLSKLNIWDKIKSVALIAASGMIGTMATYIFLKS